MESAAVEKLRYHAEYFTHAALFIAFYVHRHDRVVYAQPQQKPAVVNADPYALAVVVGNFEAEVRLGAAPALESLYDTFAVGTEIID